MKRRNFLSKLFNIGVGAAAMTIPAVAKSESKETFTLDDAFVLPYNNKNLYYIKKNSSLNQELMKAIGDHYLPKEKFGCYYPVYGQYLQVKDEYTIEDFRQLIMLLEDKREHFDYFCDADGSDDNLGLVRIVKDRSGKFYKLELFQAFRNGQYGQK